MPRLEAIRDQLAERLAVVDLEYTTNSEAYRHGLTSLQRRQAANTEAIEAARERLRDLLDEIEVEPERGSVARLAPPKERRQHS